MTYLLRSIRVTVAVAVASLAIGTVAMQPGSANIVVRPGQGASFDVKGHCPAHGGVRATPCNITLDASNPGPDIVVVRAPNSKKGSLAELDTCGTIGIASITPNADGTWTVTAGSTPGSCVAEFQYTAPHGKVVGWADVNITNNI